MQLFPQDILPSLDFGFIKDEVARLCTTPQAKALAAALAPTSDTPLIREQLLAVDEILAVYLAGESFPSTYFEPVVPHAHTLKTRGSVLEEKAFSDIRSCLLAYAHLYEYLEKRKGRFAVLFSHLETEPPLSQLARLIDDKIDERAQVRSNASRELAHIRSQLVKSRASASRVFERVLKKYREKGYLGDFDETVSEDRRVLAIQSAYKGQVQGIFHGSSSKNSLVYIEPGETVEINNEVAQLIDDEKQEIRRILKELSDELRPYCQHFIKVEQLLTRLDFIKAKALYAKNENCALPEITREAVVEIREGYNPVLYALNRQKNKPTRPLNLTLDANQRILVISGPNAGGKSIALKTLGLLSGMLQSGLLVPVHPASRFRIFENIFADIGDSQSIQNELSTYSSKLQKMRHFLSHADENTLLLIDEFGSGSDPELGSSLAQVFLEKLNSFKVFGIFTTHYNAIKALAAELPGVNNAAMLFDKTTLSPEYLLEIGNPGSSYTFEVAQQSGIAPHIIKEARSKTAQNTLEVDRLLVQLQDDKLQLQKKQEKLATDLAHLKELEREKEKTIGKLEEKLSKQSRLNEENDRLVYWGQRFQKLVESWMDQKGKKDKKEVVGRFVGLLNQRSAEVEVEEKETVSKAQSKRDQKINELKTVPVQVGDRIKILDTGMTGTINEIKKDRYQVALGNNITTTLNRGQFIPTKAPLEKRPKLRKRKKGFIGKEDPKDPKPASDKSKDASKS